MAVTYQAVNHQLGTHLTNYHRSSPNALLLPPPPLLSIIFLSFPFLSTRFRPFHPYYTFPVIPFNPNDISFHTWFHFSLLGCFCHVTFPYVGILPPHHLLLRYIFPCTFRFISPLNTQLPRLSSPTFFPYIWR